MILMVCTIMVIITMTYGLPTGSGNKSVDTVNVSIVQLNVYNHVKEHDNYAFEHKIPNILANKKSEIHTDQVKFNEIKVDIKKNVFYKKTLQGLLIKLIQMLKLAETENKGLDKKNMDSYKNEADIDDSPSRVIEDNTISITSNHFPGKDQTLFPIFSTTSSSEMEVTFPAPENSYLITTNKSYVSTTSLLDERTTKFVLQQKTVTSSMIEIPSSNLSTTTSLEQKSTQRVSQNETIFSSSTPAINTTASKEPTITTPQPNANSTEKSVFTSSDNTSILSSATTSTTTTKNHQTNPTESFSSTKEEEKTTTMNWLKWCQNQCRLGTGGTACDCDIIP